MSASSLRHPFGHLLTASGTAPSGFTQSASYTTFTCQRRRPHRRTAGTTVGTDTGVFGQQREHGPTHRASISAILVFEHLADLDVRPGHDNVRTTLAAAAPMDVAFSGNMGQLRKRACNARCHHAVWRLGDHHRQLPVGSWPRIDPGLWRACRRVVDGIGPPMGPEPECGCGRGLQPRLLVQNGGASGNIDTPRVMAYATYRPTPRVNIDAVAGFAYDIISGYGRSRSSAPMRPRATTATRRAWRCKRAMPCPLAAIGRWCRGWACSSCTSRSRATPNRAPRASISRALDQHRQPSAGL